MMHIVLSGIPRFSNTCSGSRSRMWPQVTLNPEWWLFYASLQLPGILSWADIFGYKHLSEATLRKKACCKSFPFSPFVNCANACVQLWHSQEVDLFKQSQESTLKSQSLAQFGSRSRASQNPPNDALACSDFGSREKLRLYKTQTEVREKLIGLLQKLSLPGSECSKFDYLWWCLAYCLVERTGVRSIPGECLLQI